MAWFVRKIVRNKRECKLFESNIFDLEWKDAGQTVEYKDPVYKVRKNFQVYTVIDGGTEHRFAYCETSPQVWMFLTEK